MIANKIVKIDIKQFYYHKTLRSVILKKTIYTEILQVWGQEGISYAAYIWMIYNKNTFIGMFEALFLDKRPRKGIDAWSNLTF